MLGIHDEALKSYDRALAVNPRYKHAWYNKGYTYHGIDKLEEAIVCYKQALELDRGGEVLWNNLGRYEQSLPYFFAAIEVNPDYEIAWNNIGNALDKMGRHSESLPYHDKSLAVKPDFDYALYAKGHALSKLGKHEEGLELIDQSLELNPNYDHAWYAKADVLFHMGRFEDAREAINNSLVLNAGYDEAWMLRKWICEAMGHPEEAEYCYREALRCHDFALQVDPGNPEVLAAKVGLLVEHERPDDALALLEGSGASAGDSALAAMRAELLVCAGRGPEAVLASQEATRLDERSAAAWRARGRALMVMGQGREAVDAFKRSLEIREDRDAHLDLARVLVSLGRAEEAVSHVRLAIDLGAPVRTLLAQVLLELQKPEKALAACKAALAGGEGPGSVWFTMSQAREALGDRKGALRALAAALGADPGPPDSLF